MVDVYTQHLVACRHQPCGDNRSDAAQSNYRYLQSLFLLQFRKSGGLGVTAFMGNSPWNKSLGATEQFTHFPP